MGQAFRQDIASGDLEFGLQAGKGGWDESEEEIFGQKAGVHGANGSKIIEQSNSELLSGLSGGTVATTSLIPAGAFDVHVVVRVTTLITSGDGGTDFDIGDGLDVDAWGAAIAFAADTTTTGADWTASGLHMPAGGDVTLTCNAGTFNAGAVRVVAFYKLATAPTS